MSNNDPRLEAAVAAFGDYVVPGMRERIQQTLAAADAVAPSPWRPTHQHRKGGLYRVIGRGLIEASKAPAVIYEAEDGTLWVRPETEFDDGRFTPLPQKEGRSC